ARLRQWRRRLRASFLRALRALGGRALLRHLFLVEIAERLRDGIHRERSLVVRNREVVERDDPRQRRDVARERADVVVVAGYLDADRQLGVEVGHLLLWRRTEQVELEAAAETRLVDVRQQRVDLGAVRKLLDE